MSEDDKSQKSTNYVNKSTQKKEQLKRKRAQNSYEMRKTFKSYLIGEETKTFRPQTSSELINRRVVKVLQTVDDEDIFTWKEKIEKETDEKEKQDAIQKEKERRSSTKLFSYFNSQEGLFFFKQDGNGDFWMVNDKKSLKKQTRTEYKRTHPELVSINSLIFDYFVKDYS